jgi:UDP-N-acetylglucosamine:LPS N-acetylglucosamine transferase
VIDDHLTKKGTMENLDVAILCGSNPLLKRDLEDYSIQSMRAACDEDPKLLSQLKEFLHFVPKQRISLEEMALMGKASNAFLSKPGGGTTAEALAGGFPMLVHREEQHSWELGNIEELLLSGATEVGKEDNFYEKAKKAVHIKAPDPDLSIYPQESIDYTLEVLWKLEQLRNTG